MSPSPPPTSRGELHSAGAKKLFVLPLKKGTRVSAALLIILCVITSLWIFSSLKTSDVTSRIQTLSVNVQNDATGENPRNEQSSGNYVQNDATGKNPYIQRSSGNVQHDTTSENHDIQRSSVDVQNDVTSENPDIQRSSGNVQHDAISENPDIQQSSGNVQIDATIENPGNRRSSSHNPGNVQNDATIKNPGIQQSYDNVQNDTNTIENLGIQQSSGNVQNDATSENLHNQQSYGNVQNDSTSKIPGIQQSSISKNPGIQQNSGVNVQNDATGIQQNSGVNVQNDATSENPGIQQSSDNIQNDATIENPGIQQNSGVNVQNDTTSENPGIQQSSDNIQNDTTIENPGIQQSSNIVQNDTTIENLGIQQSSDIVQNDDATSENPGIQQSPIEKPAVMENNETKKEIKTSKEKIKTAKKLEYSLICSTGNETQTCSSAPVSDDLTPSNATCPEYFRWIHEDLKPFMSTGISRDMVERAKTTANFRLVILKGKVYVEKYKKSIQTRDLFSIWGIIQLLRMYPGRLPDLEIMFDCNDRPVINKKLYKGGAKIPPPLPPPPLFRYCSDPWSLDIVFPDWSFWGWAEINIRPWEKMVKDMKKGNKRIKWMDREPYAYWKGNPFVAETRQDLLKCNVSHQYDWNARLFVQDWIQEGEQGFKQSNLADQCTHRYKIYIEGFAWSVSEKYILACDSPTLLINTKYYDFFLRHLQPLQHYWPIRDDDKCKSIKFAVDWGNNHKQKAQEIGKAASKFMLEDLKMKFVYDYMFHLLNEYAKLIRFDVVIPAGVPEICSETMACQADGREKKFMMESMVKIPSSTSPCFLPPPYDLKDLARIFRKRDNSMKQVRKWETKFWEDPNKNGNV